MGGALRRRPPVACWREGCDRRSIARRSAYRWAPASASVDALLTVGRGQRVGIFGGSGVGKSTLIGMMTRNTEADVTVVGLVGERGREVGEFLEDALGEEGRKRSVVVVSTSDQSPLLRMRAALAATTIAEFFAAEGRHVLLVLDSLTRFAMAAREIGLAAGEPPTAKGYTPSVFTRLARLVERTGQFQNGSITAFYTVLMEGDDQQDPLVDAVRSLLDGHLLLSRALASEGWYPPIQVLDSISRLMPAVTEPAHREQAALGTQAAGRLCAVRGPGAHWRLQGRSRSRSGSRSARARSPARLHDPGRAGADRPGRFAAAPGGTRAGDLRHERAQSAGAPASHSRGGRGTAAPLAGRRPSGRLKSLEQARSAALQMEKQGRARVSASVVSGAIADRQAGLVETEAARRRARMLAARIAAAEKETVARREEFLDKRVQRRQAETMVEEAQAREDLESGRRSQRTIDDWYGAAESQASGGRGALTAPYRFHRITSHSYFDWINVSSSPVGFQVRGH